MTSKQVSVLLNLLEDPITLCYALYGYHGHSLVSSPGLPLTLPYQEKTNGGMEKEKAILT